MQVFSSAFNSLIVSVASQACVMWSAPCFTSFVACFHGLCGTRRRCVLGSDIMTKNSEALCFGGVTNDDRAVVTLCMGFASAGISRLDPFQGSKGWFPRRKGCTRVVGCVFQCTLL